MNTNYLKKVLFDTKSLSSSQLFTAIISIIQIGIVSRSLGPDKFGRAVLVITLISLIFRILHARNSDVSLLFFKSYGTTQIFTSYLFDFFISVIGAVITILVFHSSLNLLFGEYRFDLFIGLLILSRIIYSFSETAKAILTIHGQYSQLAKIEVVSTTIRFLFILFLFNYSPKIEFYFLAYASYYFVYGFISLLSIRKENIKFNIQFSDIKNYFQKTKSNYFKQRTDQFVGIVPQHFDVVILSYFADYSTVGIYRIAKRLVEPIDSLIAVLNPFMQHNLSNNNKFSIKNFFKKVLLPISAIVSLFYFALGKYLIELIAGQEFTQSNQPLRILVIGYIVYFCTFWIRQKLLFAEKIHYHSIARIIGTIVFLTFANLLTTNFKASGLAASLTLSIIFQKIYEFYIFKKYHL